MAGVGFLQSLWGKVDMGGRLSFLGSNGLCVFTHNIHGMECARKVRAARRALFLPESKGASVGTGLMRPLAPSSMLTSLLLLFSADVLKKCWLIAYALNCGRGGGDGDGMSCPWSGGTNGK